LYCGLCFYWDLFIRFCSIHVEPGSTGSRVTYVGTYGFRKFVHKEFHFTKTAVHSLNKKPPFLATFFGENIFKIITSGPDHRLSRSMESLDQILKTLEVLQIDLSKDRNASLPPNGFSKAFFPSPTRPT
jgi:hypothetical protein